jgi:hypothetical protein
VSCQGAFGRIAAYPLANLRAHSGALPLNELILMSNFVYMKSFSPSMTTDNTSPTVNLNFHDSKFVVYNI